MTTKEEKLKKLEDKIIDRLEGIEDSEALRKELNLLLLVAQIKKFKEIENV